MKNISVYVSGNPDSNGGFVPLVILNNPTFELNDVVYPGFDQCPFFFTIKVEAEQTVYKLVKNKVRSTGASRAGSLAFAFSIPKGYSLDGGCTPYDLLVELKDEFLNKCMTCKDPIHDIYEFNSPTIDKNVLDEKVKAFSISPSEIPHRAMNPSGPVGYVTLDESIIKDFFKDVYYPEFQVFREVIVATTVTNTTYMKIPNLKVPRLKLYSIIINGNEQNAKVGDIDKKIEISSGSNSDPCFEHRTESFTIREILEETRAIEGISFNSANESIIVDTTHWTRPRIRKYKVEVSPTELKNISEHIKLCLRNKEIPLDQDNTFALKGSEIGRYNDIQILLRYHDSDIEIVHSEFSNEGIKITVKHKTKKTVHEIAFPAVNTEDVVKVPVIDIKLLFSGSFMTRFTDSESRSLRIQVRSNNRKTDKILLSSIVGFKQSSGARSKYEGHLYVPKELLSGASSLYFANKRMYFEFYDIRRIVKNGAPLSEIEFHPQKKTFYQMHGFLVLNSILLFLVLFIGFVSGFFVHDPVTNFFNISPDKIELPDYDDADDHTKTDDSDTVVTTIVSEENENDRTIHCMYRSSCDKTFQDTSALNKHLILVHKTCLECTGKYYKTLEGLVYHYKKAHNKYLCKYCADIFEDEEAYNTHLKEKHPSEIKSDGQDKIDNKTPAKDPESVQQRAEQAR